MASLPVELPYAVDSSFTVGYSQPALGHVSRAVQKTLLPVGTAFQEHCSRVINKLSLEEHAALIIKELQNLNLNSKADLDEDDDDGAGDEPESRSLLQLDPRDWKNQDQYAVLGLSSLRWKATPDQIKRAHRKKVLRHHPDKKAGQAGNANDDSFFKCIAKAYEVLSDPVKRRQFDSVDDEIDDGDLPTEKEVQASPEAFFKSYRPVFKREARFSNKQPIPDIGDMGSTRDEVEVFYDFWLKFDSWRSFEWRDKDANEGSDSRTEKRHIENKNRSERERRKKEDNARRRNIVETALSLDPRLKKFKAEERLAREAKKNTNGQGKNSQEQKVPPGQEAAADLKVQAPSAEVQRELEREKQDREKAKKAKELAKKNLKKEKKSIQSLIVGLNYFLQDGQTPNPSLIEAQLTDLDTLCSGLEPEDVSELRKKMEHEKAQSGNAKGSVKTLVIQFAKKVADSGKGSFKQFV